MKHLIYYQPPKKIGVQRGPEPMINNLHLHLIALWLLVLALSGLRVWDFYQGDNQSKKINSALWNLKKGQKQVLEYLKYQESYDDD
jgi:hypothetical protein